MLRHCAAAAIMTGPLETLDCNSKAGQDPEPLVMLHRCCCHLKLVLPGAHVILQDESEDVWTMYVVGGLPQPSLCVNLVKKHACTMYCSHYVRFMQNCSMHAQDSECGYVKCLVRYSV